jgi:hypothetical protein
MLQHILTPDDEQGPPVDDGPSDNWGGWSSGPDIIDDDPHPDGPPPPPIYY